MNRLALGCLLLLLTLTAWGTPSVSRFQFASGLQVIVERAPDAPLTTVEVWVRVGVAQETAETSGVSHLLEHLLFRGAAGLTTDALDRAFENAGGVLDASTERDWTRFRASVLPDRWREPLQTLLRSLLFPALPADALEKERRLILNDEYATHHADPIRPARYALFAELFPQHPYGLPLLGNPDTLARVNTDAIRQFHQTHYRPDRMVVVVVGAVEPDAVRQAVEAVWSAVAQTAQSPTPRTEAPLQPIGEVALAHADGCFALGWRTPPAHDIESWLCAEVLRIALAEPHWGLLYEGEPPFGRLQSEYLPRLQGSALAFYALPPWQPREDWQGQTRQRFQRALQQIAAGERRAALEQARATALARHTATMRNPIERARWHGLCAALNLPLTPEAFAARLRELPLETVEAFAARLRGAPSAPTPSAVQQAAPALPRPAPRAAEPAIARQRLANGLRVIALAAPNADSVVIQVAIGHTPDDSPAAGELTMRMLFGATQNETERTLAARIARSGGSLRVEWTPAGALITAYARPDSVVNVLALLKEAIFRAAFSDESLERARLLALYDRRYPESGRAWRLIGQLLSSYADEDALARVRLRDILAYYRSHYQPYNTVIAAAGDLPVERLTEFVRLIFGAGWEASLPSKPTEPPRAPARMTTVADPRGLHYTGYGWAIPVDRADDYYALLVWQIALWEGKRARLFVAAREHNGVGYDLRGETWLMRGACVGVGWLQTGKSPAPAQLLRNAFNNSLSEEEFQRARTLLRGAWEQLRMNLAAFAAALAWAELSGLGYETVWNAPVRLQSLTREAVEQKRAELLGSR